MPKILVFAGSARKTSWNKRLARAAAAVIDQTGGAATFIDLADYPMPIYDGDIEQDGGLPDNARKLKKLFLDHDGLLIACPEYNGSITPLLKNTIDWVSRPETKDEPSLACYRGKVVGLVATSPGGLGGMRGLVIVRSLLGNIGCLVLSEQKAFPKAFELFDEDGKLKQDSNQAALQRVADALVETTRRLATGSD